jgi:hypothetical protein
MDADCTIAQSNSQLSHDLTPEQRLEVRSFAGQCSSLKILITGVAKANSLNK